MIIAGVWGVAPCNLLSFTEVLEKNTFSIFGVEDVGRTCIHGIPYRRSNFHKITQGHTVEDVFLHSFSQLFTFRILV